MSRQMTEALRLQWLSSRWLLVPLVLLCIGLPQAVVRLSMRYSSGMNESLTSAVVLQSIQGLTVVFPYLAAITGAAIALAAWDWDHRTRHIYALSLPIPRAQYALLKLWAGAVILLVPTFAIWLGAWIATATVAMPAGLQAYPFAFGARFLLAGTLVYAAVFALASGTIRTTLIVFIGFTLVLVLGGIAVSVLETTFGRDLITPIELLGAALHRWPGPFEAFGGSWMLIDV